jgi:hypothetical protein
MKKLLFLSILCIVYLSSCKKKLSQFHIDYTSKTTIQSTFGQFIPFSVFTPETTTNSEVEFENNNTRKDKIESIRLEDLVLTITSPSNETFSFLNEIEIFISSPKHSEQKVAFKKNIPSTVGNQIICDLTDIDLQSFVKDDTFTIRIKAITDETIAQDVDIDIYSNFFVDAKFIK